jgi:hypothetical protein
MDRLTGVAKKRVSERVTPPSMDPSKCQAETDMLDVILYQYTTPNPNHHYSHITNVPFTLKHQHYQLPTTPMRLLPTLSYTHHHFASVVPQPVERKTYHYNVSTFVANSNSKRQKCHGTNRGIKGAEKRDCWTPYTKTECCGFGGHRTHQPSDTQ